MSIKQTVQINVGKAILTGDLVVPPESDGIVLFAHGSGSSRKSVRNRAVARIFNSYGFGTLLFDLLTVEEEEQDRDTGELRFDIDLLAERLIGATHWVKKQPFLDQLLIGYFGASTGGAAALMAASQLDRTIHAIVSRGGRPDLAPRALPLVRAPTLLIVGENDSHVLSLNRQAYEMLHCEKHIDVVPGASHLFEEPGAMNEVAQLALEWFKSHIKNAFNRVER